MTPLAFGSQPVGAGVMYMRMRTQRAATRRATLLALEKLRASLGPFMIISASRSRWPSVTLPLQLAGRLFASLSLGLRLWLANWQIYHLLSSKSCVSTEILGRSLSIAMSQGLDVGLGGM